MHQAGPQTVVVKALDAAGNPSAEITGTTQLIDTAPPGNWQFLVPTGWVTATAAPAVRAYVADELTGIASGSAVVRFTTDAGISWSAWQPISATARPDGSAELVWTWPGGEGSGANRVQFRVADNAGLTSASPAWPVRVDVTPPAATLIAPRWAAVGTPFTVQWTGQDNIGLASFDVQVGVRLDVTLSGSNSRFSLRRASSEGSLLALENDTWQDWLSGTPATQASYLASAPGRLLLRVRARDLAGNIGPWSAAQMVTVVRVLSFLPFVASR
jgi:hypothetical protein